MDEEESMTHLASAHGFALCGALLGVEGEASEVLGEITCPTCILAADRLNVILTRARRNGAAPRLGVNGVLEQKADDGTWYLFSLASWVRAPLGEYNVTLRVRASTRQQS